MSEWIKGAGNMLSRRDFGKLTFAGIGALLGLKVLPKPRGSEWVGIVRIWRPDAPDEIYVNGKRVTSYEENVAATNPIAYWPLELSY